MRLCRRIWICSKNDLRNTLALIGLVLTLTFVVNTRRYQPDERDQDEQFESDYSSNIEPTLTKTKTKWIVITSISKPTEDIKYMADNLKDWQVLVVGDKKSPSDWSYPNCIFLRLIDQQRLGYGIIDLLPNNSYARKSIGYLYAIEHGASVIYDTDDDNRPLLDNDGRLRYFDFDHSNDRSAAIVVESTSQSAWFNPYQHFGREDVWPRGFSLRSINTDCRNRTRSRLRSAADRPPAIQQGLVDHDPDVDAIYRLIFYRQNYTIGFDRTSPPILLGKNVYSPFNSQNTLFRYEAFWALIIPITVSFRVSDIWRGYWAQKLLWEIDRSLAFYPPNARQHRNVHDYFADYLDERRLYDDVDRLIELLNRFRCETDRRLIDCALRLASEMVREQLWNEPDRRLIQTWFDDLIRLGYRFPPLVKVTEVNLPSSPIGYVSSFDGTVPKKEQRQTDSLKRLARFCRGVSIGRLAYSAFSTIGYDHAEKTVLVVVFNRPHHTHLHLLRTLYQPWFANVVFCSTFSGSSPSSSATDGDSTFDPDRNFSYVNVTREELRDGYFGYVCLEKVIEMGMRDVAGYMVIGDDVLLNFWTKLDPTRVHLHNACENIQERGKGWQWWNSSVGVSALESLRDQLLSTIDLGGNSEKVDDENRRIRKDATGQSRSTQLIDSQTRVAVINGSEVTESQTAEVDDINPVILDYMDSPGLSAEDVLETRSTRATGVNSAEIVVDLGGVVDTATIGRFPVDLDQDVRERLLQVLMHPVYCASDIYYVPRSSSMTFARLSRLFRGHGVFSEIAVPKILAVLGWHDRYENVRKNVLVPDLIGDYLWGIEERGNPFRKYRSKQHFLHPFKLSLLDQPPWKSQFCNYYVGTLFEAVNSRQSEQ